MNVHKRQRFSAAAAAAGACTVSRTPSLFDVVEIVVRTLLFSMFCLFSPFGACLVRDFVHLYNHFWVAVHFKVVQTSEIANSNSWQWRPSATKSWISWEKSGTKWPERNRMPLGPMFFSSKFSLPNSCRSFCYSKFSPKFFNSFPECLNRTLFTCRCSASTATKMFTTKRSEPAQSWPPTDRMSCTCWTCVLITSTIPSWLTKY